LDNNFVPLQFAEIRELTGGQQQPIKILRYNTVSLPVSAEQPCPIVDKGTI